MLNHRREKLGDIEAIMLDVASGRIAYAVVVVEGSFFGTDDKLFAIPRPGDFLLAVKTRCAHVKNLPSALQVMGFSAPE